MEDLVSYREQIRSVYLKRLLNNKSYSLRAMARDLSLDPGQLSLVLSGKKNISLSKASELSKKLFTNQREMIIFYHSVEYEAASTEEAKKSIREKLKNLRESHSQRNANISEDEFEVISNWYNIPMLELAGVKNFEVTGASAADYFGITELEASLGLRALSRLGFIKKTGLSYKSLRPVTTTTEISSFAIKSFHNQMINKALKALFHQDLKKRYFSGATFSFPADKLDEVKKLIDEHEKRIVDLALSYQNGPNQVIYQMNTQLFSLNAKDYKNE